MPQRRPTAFLLCLLAAAALAGGCGRSSSSSQGGEAPSRPAPPGSDFPSAAGRTLAEVLKDANPATEMIALPAAMAFYQGENRFPFGVYNRDRTQINDAQVALYIAKNLPRAKPKGGSPATGTTAKAKNPALEAPAVGPFPARIESLATEPAFRARTTADERYAARVAYVSKVDFPSNGDWRVVALIKRGNGLLASLMPSVVVGEFQRVPRVGERAPLIHTPTAASAHGDLSKVTTRIPPDTQNRVDYASVFGKKPIILLFATPQFCQSRVCGPVVDVAEQVKQGYGDKAAFIHMEIYKNNNPNAGVRPQVKAFHLPSEPWLFAIDRHGIIRASIEGPFGSRELTQVVKAVSAE